MEMGKKLNEFNKKLDEIKNNNIAKFSYDKKKEMYLQVKKEKLERERKEQEALKEKMEGK